MRERHYGTMIPWYCEILPLLCYDSMRHDTLIVWDYEWKRYWLYVALFCVFVCIWSTLVCSYCPASFSSFVFLRICLRFLFYLLFETVFVNCPASSFALLPFAFLLSFFGPYIFLFTPLPGDQTTTGPEPQDQRTTGPGAQDQRTTGTTGTRGPQDQRTTGPGPQDQNHRTRGPEDHRTRAPQDHRSSAEDTGPEDHRTRGPQDQDHRIRGPQDQRSLNFFSRGCKYFFQGTWIFFPGIVNFFSSIIPCTPIPTYPYGKSLYKPYIVGIYG